MVRSSPQPRSAPIASPQSAALGGGVNGGVNCIIHTVSKFDTLAGVAIKYGVEVADIKRLNGLVTDLQMFALKTLQIPLPGRHPPSPNLSNSQDTPPRYCIHSQYLRVCLLFHIVSIFEVPYKNMVKNIFDMTDLFAIYL
ncbi:UNVERIFIED_CONTAM: hypothetical protein Sangu_2695000 [Sesamum angustifolium]|uniref:LysM domain-containing protein n=1 Tax=Sesamum angustifolium TaxID=2727405 RepID=A0AAW2IZ06_9LAMI